MKTHNISKLLGIATATVCVSLAVAPTAQAQVLGSNWTYTMDSFADGNDGGTGVGLKSNYEMYGMAMKAQDGIISIAFNANLALAGQYESSVKDDNNIGWGDVLFNFSGKSLKDASAAGELFGIRFAGTNDSGVATTGVFSGVTAQNVAQQNSGFSSFSSYQNTVNNNANNTNTGTKGGQIGYGGATVDEAKTYLTSQTTMKTVTKVIEVPVVKTVTKAVREQVTTMVDKPTQVMVDGKKVTKMVPTPVTKWVTKKVTEQVTVMEKKTVKEQVPVTAINDSSYGQLNAIASGTKVGDISFLGASEIASLASGFAGFGGIGKYTVGFSFSQTLLGQFLQPANAVITLLEECTNDGMMLQATLPSTTPPVIPDGEPVPEPMTMLGMALGGLGLIKGKMNQRRAARVTIN